MTIPPKRLNLDRPIATIVPQQNRLAQSLSRERRVLAKRGASEAALARFDQLRVFSTPNPSNIVRWTRGGFARSSTSTWTPSMRPSNSATIQLSGVDQLRSATQPKRRRCRGELRGAPLRGALGYAFNDRDAKVRRARFRSAEVRRLPRGVKADPCDLHGLHPFGRAPLSR